MYDAGLGAVVTKSIGPRARKGNPNPSIFALQEIKSVINSVGLANPGYKVFREDIKKLVEKEIPTIASIFGETEQEFAEVVSGLGDLDVLAFELNLSCPNIESGGALIGTEPETVFKIVNQIKSITSTPLWVKLTPNVNNIVEIAEAAVKGGCDAIVAINTLKAMVIDIETQQPILGFKRGGLSGAAIKPIGVRHVYDLYESLGDKAPIVGVGGISSGEDVIEYLLAGAKAVQIGTALGVAFPENMVRFFQMKILKYMKEHNIEKITELVGGAHK
jgi:dihydroorotate dehydrogenase (NAD+) catalytic subunit